MIISSLRRYILCHILVQVLLLTELVDAEEPQKNGFAMFAKKAMKDMSNGWKAFTKNVTKAADTTGTKAGSTLQAAGNDLGKGFNKTIAKPADKIYQKAKAEVKKQTAIAQGKADLALQSHESPTAGAASQAIPLVAPTTTPSGSATTTTIQANHNYKYQEVTASVSDCEGLQQAASYCMARYGPQGTSWEQKPTSSGRKSKVLLTPSTNPACDLAFRMNAASNTEIMVRLFSEVGGLVGSLTVPAAKDDASSLPSIFSWGEDVGVSSGGLCSLKLIQGNALNNVGVTENDMCEGKNPMAPERAVKVDDITKDGPFIIGVHPLPETLQGLWWMTNQGNGLAIMSFGGPNDDGGCCNTGFLEGPQHQYKVRQLGDRTAAFASLQAHDYQKSLDPEYNFQFDQFNGANPISAAGSHITEVGVSSYRVNLESDADAHYPTSKTWAVGSDGTKLVQVLDGSGNRLEPAWTLFKQSMNTLGRRLNTGDSTGWLFYHSILPSPSAGSDGVLNTARARVGEDVEAGSSSSFGSGSSAGVWGGIVILCCALIPLGLLVAWCLSKKNSKQGHGSYKSVSSGYNGHNGQHHQFTAPPSQVQPYSDQHDDRENRSLITCEGLATSSDEEDFSRTSSYSGAPRASSGYAPTASGYSGYGGQSSPNQNLMPTGSYR